MERDAERRDVASWRRDEGCGKLEIKRRLGLEDRTTVMKVEMLRGILEAEMKREALR